MADSCLQNSKDLRISGLKFSNELVQFNFLCHHKKEAEGFSKLLAEVSTRQINLPFLKHSDVNSSQYCFCVEQCDEDGISQILAQHPDLAASFNCIKGVGLITVFPHRSNFVFVAAILELFASSSAPVYSLGTSVSNLSIATDFDRLDEMANIIQHHFPLPENHAPFRQQLRIEQIFPDTTIR